MPSDTPGQPKTLDPQPIRMQVVQQSVYCAHRV